MMAEAKHISEDDLFRSSTQYRFWAYSPEALESLRKATNDLAVTRVRKATRKARPSIEKGDDGAEQIDCLTPEEELKIVGFYCFQTMDFADFLKFPTNIKATAVQYLKRFYLSNSPMTHHPKQFMPTALFLATKTDNHYMSLSKFASSLPNTTPESVKAPEFTLVQGLRFTFDVKHPHRGLEGGFMELQDMANSRYVPRTISPLSTQSIAESLLTVPPADESKPWEPSIKGVQKRLQHAHERASHLLKTSALLSDAYFLYTPAQIWLSAFLAADEPLAEFYLKTILSGAPVSTSDPPSLSSDVPASTAEPFESMLAALEGCKQLLVSKAAGKPQEAELKELRKIDKKLSKCHNLAKADTDGSKVGVPDKKRDSEEGTGEEEGRSAKKRRVEDDDVFGGELGK